MVCSSSSNSSRCRCSSCCCFVVVVVVIVVVVVVVVVVCSRLLTWRDMQHIVVQTARRANLQADDWVTNGAGYNGISRLALMLLRCIGHIMPWFVVVYIAHVSRSYSIV